MVEYINTPQTRLGNSSSKNCLKYNRITNCITEIPQDIKIENRQDGTYILTGSVIHIPNGFEADGVTKKFSKFILSVDIQIPFNLNSYQVLGLNLGDTNRYRTVPNLCFSGDTAPSNPQYTTIWYDTKSNKIKRYLDNAWKENNFSFPIALLNYPASGQPPIIKTFNGFGYIGSTVFVLPGVKGLIPNGRNPDGTLKNIQYINQEVLTFNVKDPNDCIINLYNTNLKIATYTSSHVFIQESMPVTSYNLMLWFDLKNNLFKYTEDNGNTWYNTSLFNVANISSSDGKISSFNPYEPIKLLDYNDTVYIAHQSFPSDRYIDLTLGVSGTTYIAPADGYFSLNGIDFPEQPSTNCQFVLRNQTRYFGISNFCIDSPGGWSEGYLPAKRGDVCYVYHKNITNETHKFRFYYAEGN